MNKSVIGIDYSTTGPAACYHPAGKWNPKKCYSIFVDSRKKYINTFKDGHGYEATGYEGYKGSDTYSHRYEHLSKIFTSFINAFGAQEIALEGYAFAARGRVFNIGEATGLLKWKIEVKLQKRLEIFQPPEVKKFATGKGNAKKGDMYEAFFDDTGINLSQIMDCQYDKGPINDLVDAYWIAKLLHSRG